MLLLKRQSGMTLFEILIAVAVLSILATIGFIGIDSMLKAQQRIEQKNQQLNRQNVTFFMLQSDVFFAISSYNFKGTQKIADFSGSGSQFSLTRLAQIQLPEALQTPNQLGDVLRIRWSFYDGFLYREQISSVQRADTDRWQKQQMMPLKSWQCDYKNSNGQILHRWPNQTFEKSLLPKTISCQFRLIDERSGKIELTTR